MSKFRQFTRQIPLLIIWLMASGLLWSFVFLRITDADPAHKIVVFVDAETTGAEDLAAELFDQRRGNIRTVQVRPFTYAMLDSNQLTNADLYIVPESDMLIYLDWFAPCPDGFTQDAYVNPEDGLSYGLLIRDPSDPDSLFSRYIQFVPEERYYLCFGKNSLHLNGQTEAGDNEAVYFADILLNME